jgi:hypothetical protein
MKHNLLIIEDDKIMRVTLTDYLRIKNAMRPLPNPLQTGIALLIDLFLETYNFAFSKRDTLSSI